MLELLSKTEKKLLQIEFDLVWYIPPTIIILGSLFQFSIYQSFISSFPFRYNLAELIGNIILGSRSCVDSLFLVSNLIVDTSFFFLFFRRSLILIEYLLSRKKCNFLCFILNDPSVLIRFFKVNISSFFNLSS